MTFKDGKTAAEYLAERQKDPDFRARQKAREEAADSLDRELAIAETPLLRELADVGLRIQSVWDLVNTDQSYPSAIPVLASHLTRSYPTQIREGIARALAVAEARPMANTLIEAFRQETDELVRWTIGNTLAVVADESLISVLVELAKNPTYGDSRQMLLLGLRTIGTEHSRTALRELLKDQRLAWLASNLSDVRETE